MTYYPPRFLQPGRWALYLSVDLGVCARETNHILRKIESCATYGRTAADLHNLWRKTSLYNKLWYLSRIGLGPFGHPHRLAITRVFADLLRAQRSGAMAPVVDSYLRGDYATAEDLRDDLHYVLRKASLPASKNPGAAVLLEILLEHEKDQKDSRSGTLLRYHETIELPWLLMAMAQEHLYSRGFAAHILSILPSNAALWLSSSVLHGGTDRGDLYTGMNHQLTEAFPQLPCPQDERIKQCQICTFGGYLPGTYQGTQDENAPKILVPSSAGALHGPRTYAGKEAW